MATFAIIIIVALFIALAFWQKSNFLQIVAGVVAIGFGVYWIGTSTAMMYLIEGIAAIGLGLYMLIMVGYDLIKGR